MGMTPTKFILYVGGYFGNNVHVEWNGSALVYSFMAGGSEPQPEVVINPSAQDWSVFWASFEKVGGWKWKPKYEEPVCDGTQWEIEIKYEGHRLLSEGSNGYPTRTGRQAKGRGVFDEYCTAVERLLGGREFR